MEAAASKTRKPFHLTQRSLVLEEANGSVSGFTIQNEYKEQK